MGEFVSLHHHSTFSYQDGFRMPEEHVARAAELGMKAMALTEHGNVTSHVKLEQAAIAHDIKPIFGIEAYTGGVGEDRTRFKWHLTMLASNQIGLANLYEMTSRGWSEGFYYEPTISGQMLSELNEGVIVLSGCSGSKLACDLLGGKGVPDHDADINAATRTAERFRELLGDRYYLEVQAFPELKRTVAMNQAYLEISGRTGIPYVVTTDAHYPHPHDNEMQLLIHAIDRGGKNNTIEKQAQGWGYDIALTDHKDKKLIKKLVACGFTKKQAQRAIAASAEIADRCNVKLPKLEDLRYTGEVELSLQTFREWIRQGWAYRGFDRLSGKTRKEYSARLKYEMELIEQKGFVDYFLVVSDVVKFAKDNGIPVGPARGSAAASLVCYLLRITEVEPMKFPNLIFERFIDINRHDLPDIDLDFDDERRHLVREYLVEKYGEERVGNIGTFTKYKGKNSIDDVARVHKVPKFATDGVKEMLIERSSGDLRAGATIEDTIEMFPKVKKIFDQYPVLYKAQQLEGNLRGFSVHAAGLVVANEPLTNSVAVYERRDDKGNVIGNVLSIDKHDAEYINALKIDVLGLTTMGMIRRCLEMIGMTLEELYAVPLDEEKVFDGFRRNEVIGIFQFDGRAMRSVNREVKPDNFAEVCDINALARPGPLHSGAAAEYIMVKHGKKKAQILHPIVGEITAHTNQQIVYQEQILQVVRRLGSFTWEEAALIRKLISKKQGEQAFNRMMDKFIQGAVKDNGMSETNAVRVWKQLVTAGAYAFNAAHCVSYGMLAYWTMWLKQNYPLEFYCAALQKYDPKTKGFDLLKEAILDKGITVLPPDPVQSGLTWSYDKEAGSLRAGLLQVNGIGEKTAEAMLEYREMKFQESEFCVLCLAGEHAREDHGVKSWGDYTAVRGIGPVTMRKVEEFVSDPDPFGVHVMGRTLSRIRKVLWHEGDILGIPSPTSKSEDVPYEAIRGDHVWAGIVRDRNLKDIYELHRSRTGEELDPKSVREPQYVNYVVLTGEDETGPLNITIPRFGGFYERFKDVIWNMDVKRDILIVKGYKRNEYRRAITATDLWVINPENT